VGPFSGYLGPCRAEVEKHMGCLGRMYKNTDFPQESMFFKGSEAQEEASWGHNRGLGGKAG
jgi:hypothetical protein